MTYPDSKAYPMATSRHIRPECTVMKDLLWKMENDNQIEPQFPFEQSSDSFGGRIFPDYKTPLMDHNEGEGIFVNLNSILKMRIERAEVA